MSSFTVGRQAEAVAVDYLRRRGYQILEQNWRTRYCEIDVIARKAKTICFVEVKYRAASSQGDGLDYITPTKLKQMSFAANFWVQNHHWTGDYQLAVMAVTGSDFSVTALVAIDA